MLQVIQLTPPSNTTVQAQGPARRTVAALILAGLIAAPILSAIAVVAFRGSVEDVAAVAGDEFTGWNAMTGVGASPHRQAAGPL